MTYFSIGEGVVLVDLESVEVFKTSLKFQVE